MKETSNWLSEYDSASASSAVYAQAHSGIRQALRGATNKCCMLL
jgi:hypothetical protein